ncbi:MAG: EamA family transporter [Rhodobacteraceae bacterium CG17_big_fil_post_rev_8_21_14_2_50_65_11]|nr:MAG: EamA family transporter [Rhodobacteraceae bacterium CG17_big_fil_post_rev_8_21_14_2_50_65_11]
MGRSDRAFLIGVLVFCALGWGLSIPVGKVAVSQGYRHVGIIFWQFVIGAVVLGLFNLARRRGLPWHPRALRFYLVIALIGTLLPNTASYTAAIHLPAGVIALLIASVPMIAFPMALIWRLDRFSPARLAGLGLGMLAVILIAAPETSLPDPAMLTWLPVGLIAPIFYAFEANYVSVRQPDDLDAVQALLGASLVGTPLALLGALVTGEWISPLPPWGAPDLAIGIASLGHALSYATYVWLLRRAGAVFAAQVAYLVTGFAVFWSWVLLGETYSTWVWAAFAVMFAGLFLVQPKPRAPLVVTGALGKDTTDVMGRDGT